MFEARSPVGKDFNDCLQGKKFNGGLQDKAAIARPPRLANTSQPRRPCLHADRQQHGEKPCAYLRRMGWNVAPDVPRETLKNLAFQQDLAVKQRLEERAA